MCRFAIRDKNGGKWVNEKHNNHFLNYDPNSLYPVTSNFFPIDYFENSTLAFTDILAQENRSIFFNNEDKMLFLQVKVLLTSEEMATNDKANSSYLFFTFPVDVENFTIADYNDESGFSDLDAFLYENNDMAFVSDMTFREDKTFFYDGYVTFDANVRLAPGKKVKIYTTKEFQFLDNADVDSNIELIVGYPFDESPMPPATIDVVNGFCSSSKYKAQYFSGKALALDDRKYVDKKNKRVLVESIYPNPNEGSFRVKLEKNILPVTEFTVTDLFGQTVHQQTLIGDLHIYEVDLPNLSNGVYLIHFFVGNQKETKKIIISK